MIRTILLSAPLALLAACGPVAEESDEPGAVPSPTPSDVATATAAPGPAEAGAGEPATQVQASIVATPPAARPREFAQCSVCHKVEPGAKSLGPSLAGVYGAKAGHVGDFAYSAAMRQSGVTWDEATLDRYLEAPAKALPGTKMSYPGLKDPAKRQAVIDYLKTL